MRLLEALLIFIVSIAVICLSGFLWGVTWSYFWSWFIVPTFNVEAITYAQGVGLWLMASLVKSRTNDEGDKSVTIVRALIVPPFILLIGYIFTLILG